jgi:hypothetical protein
MAKKTKKTEQPTPAVEPNPAIAAALEGTGFSTLHEAMENAMKRLKENKPENTGEASDED